MTRGEAPGERARTGLIRYAGGVLLIAAGTIAIIGLASVRPAASRFDPGPTVFPLIVAGVLVVLGTWELVAQWRSGPATSVEAPDAGSLRLLIALVVFVFVFGQLGFLVATGLLTAFVCRELGGSWRLAAVMAVVVPLTELALFQWVLGVRLIGV